MKQEPTLQELIDLQKNPKPLKRTPMRNTLKPLPSFEAKENTSEPSYVKELRYAFLEGYNEARQEFQKDTERLKTVITLDREEAVRFAETLLAAARKPTTAMIHAAHDYNDSVVEHCDFCDKPDVFQKGLCPICFEDHYGK